MAYPLVQLILAPLSPDDNTDVRSGDTVQSRHESQPQSTPDLDVARRIRAGDLSAFEALFHAHYQGLVTYLTRTLGATWEAEELAQRVFVRLWDRRADFQPTTGVRAYLYGAARHAALNQFRELRRPAPPPDAGRGTDPAGADTLLERQELTAAIRSAVNRLPDRAREIWTLHRDHDLTYAEIASLLGVSVNTVKTQLARSLAAIRKAAEPFLVIVLAARL